MDINLILNYASPLPWRLCSYAHNYVDLVSEAGPVAEASDEHCRATKIANMQLAAVGANMLLDLARTVVRLRSGLKTANQTLYQNGLLGVSVDTDTPENEAEFAEMAKLINAQLAPLISGVEAEG